MTRSSRQIQIISSLVTAILLWPLLSRAHTWSVPSSTDAASPGDFAVAASLLVEDQSVSLKSFEVVEHENVRNVSGNVRPDCTSTTNPGQQLSFDVRGQLADSRISGSMRVRLAVCGGAGTTEWMGYRKHRSSSQCPCLVGPHEGAG